MKQHIFKPCSRRRHAAVLKSKRGDGYIDVVVGVLVSMMLIVLALNVLSFFTLHQDLDYFAKEMIEAACADGQTGGEAVRRAEELSEELGISPSYSWNAEYMGADLRPPSTAGRFHEHPGAVYGLCPGPGHFSDPSDHDRHPFGPVRAVLEVGEGNEKTADFQSRDVPRQDSRAGFGYGDGVLRRFPVCFHYDHCAGQPGPDTACAG